MAESRGEGGDVDEDVRKLEEVSLIVRFLAVYLSICPSFVLLPSYLTTWRIGQGKTSVWEGEDIQVAFFPSIPFTLPASCILKAR